MINKVKENLQKIADLRKAFYPTPLFEISIKYKNKPLKFYAKSEMSTFSGSVKDRMVSYILEQGYLNEKLKIDDKIIEVTSGCTGIALSTISKFLGHKVEILIPDWFSKARYSLLEILGAEVHKISREDGGFFKCRELAVDISQKPGYFYLNQFDNELNIEAHKKHTAPELFQQLPKEIIQDKFIFAAGVGTGGTLMGIHKYCVDQKIDCDFYAMEPESSPLFRSGGKKYGPHRIEGINDDFIPLNTTRDQELYNEMVTIDDGDAIIMSQMLAKHGLAVGISSGGNFLSTLKMAEKCDFSRTAITIFPDGAVKYISTDLFKVEPMLDHYLSKNIEVLNVKIASL